LRATEDSKFYIVLPEVLPSRFTLEFDFAIPAGEVWIYFGPSSSRLVKFSGAGSVAVQNTDAEIEANGRYERDGDPNRIRRGRVLADGKYVKVYVDDKRVLNVPNADMERDARILFWTDAAVDEPTLFSNFEVAAGGLKLYDALAAEGRVATQGIFFDTGSDRLRPESTPTLKEIGAMLTAHPELRLLIEGHTDAMGDDASNLALSEKRAEAVKLFLEETYGIDSSRLESKGFGESRPACDNDTAEGRQNNRRVELVRLDGAA
jgi:outer membrane protein OmpA-like peptidoglycan-associated protein